MAAVAQQQAMIDAETPGSTTHPRTKFRKDLLEFVLQLQNEGHDIILMGDFNEVYGADPDGILHIGIQCNLIDIMDRRLGFSNFATHATGRARIDYVLMSSTPAAAVVRGGYEPPGFRFFGDHRGLFLDFATDKLFGDITPILASPASRILVSSDKENCARYIEAKYRYLQDHNWFQRLETLSKDPSPNHQIAEVLDFEWLRASKHGENACTSRLPFPYSTPLAAKRRHRVALKVLVSAFKRNLPLQPAFDRAASHTSIPLPSTLEESEVELRKVNRELKLLEKNAGKHRKLEQKANLALCQQQGDKHGARILKNILVAEETKEMWRQLKFLDPSSDSGITTVDVPSDGDFTTPHCKSCTSWSTLADPVEIERALICRNRLHFGQAHGTFPTVPPFSTAVDWQASTPASTEILHNNLPFADELDATSAQVLHEFQLSTKKSTRSTLTSPWRNGLAK
jgi:endonuclease/exonuclease/phosphatase (EEP) superfamily protein YafD